MLPEISQSFCPNWLRPNRTDQQSEDKPIRIALAIVQLFDSGGLQRDCIGIARRLVQRGHEVTIFYAAGNLTLEGISLVCLPVQSSFNHKRNLEFAKAVSHATDGNFDVVVGFNKMPFLDVLYCADPPIPKPFLLRYIIPRIVGYEKLDRTCFDATSSTRCLLLSTFQRQQFIDHYKTPLHRMVVLPPTLDKSRILKLDEHDLCRTQIRKQLGLEDDAFVWLFVGGYPKSKGLDRIIRALSHFEQAKCICAGFDQSTYEKSGLDKLARDFNVSNRLIVTGRRNDIPELMASSDILVHPSRKDVTGTVILEALGNGLPVITTDVCGYSPHVREAGAGVVLTTPFDNTSLEDAVRLAKSPLVRPEWRRLALLYAAQPDLYVGLDVAVEEIERVGAKKAGKTNAYPAGGITTAAL